MKKNKGFTLTEVIVSIVIIGTIGICVLQLFMYKSKIDHQTSQKINISNKVTEIFNNFSADPSKFPNLYQAYRKNETNQYILPISTSAGDYYLLTYQNDFTFNPSEGTASNTYYQLDVEVFLNSEPYEVNGTTKFTRRIYSGRGL